jgi:hypothetical protein
MGHRVRDSGQCSPAPRLVPLSIGAGILLSLRPGGLCWLRSYAQKSHIRYVDYYAVLTDTQGGFKAELSNDGVHPNQDGYAAMRRPAQLGIAK